MSVLLLPTADSSLSISQNLKAILAVSLFDPQVTITPADVKNPIFKTLQEEILIEPNSILRYLSIKSAKPKPTDKDEELIELEELKVYRVLFEASHKEQKVLKLDETASKQLSEKLTGRSPSHISAVLSVANLIVYASLYGLIAFYGKGALSHDLQLLLWYQKYSSHPQIQSAIKLLEKHVSRNDR